MALGRLALATGWSGNVDFMTRENSLLVDHDMIQLQPDEYPHWQGQSNEKVFASFFKKRVFLVLF